MRTCTNCGQSPPAVHFISASGGWCECCMDTLRKPIKREPEPDARKYNLPTKGRPSRSKHEWNRTHQERVNVYRTRWKERKAGVPEERLTPLPYP